MDVQGDPPRVELGCGSHVPLRWTRWCALYRYKRQVEAPRFFGDKMFRMPLVAQTQSGVWEFHGKKGRLEVDPTKVLAGLRGLRFGCKHDISVPSEAYIAYLRPSALDDPDELLFDRQVVNRSCVPDLRRSFALTDDDEFDSYVFEVFQAASNTSVDRRVSRRSNLRLQRIKRFIDGHAFEPIALSDIAACVGVTPFTCIRIFTAGAGVTPHRYLDAVRLERAQLLLATTRATIGEIAQRIGMRDRCYFTRWFAKQTGVSPKAFRRITA
jgi:AraC-like DNA-binding protein